MSHCIHLLSTMPATCIWYHVVNAADDDDLELAILVVLMLFAVLEVVVRTSCGLPPTHEESTISAWGDWGSLLTII